MLERLILSLRTFQTQIVVPAEWTCHRQHIPPLKSDFTEGPLRESLPLPKTYNHPELLAFLGSYLCSRSISSLHLLRTLCQAGKSIISQNSLEVQVRYWRADALTHLPSRDTSAGTMRHLL